MRDVFQEAAEKRKKKNSGRGARDAFAEDMQSTEQKKARQAAQKATAERTKQQAARRPEDSQWGAQNAYASDIQERSVEQIQRAVKAADKQLTDSYFTKNADAAYQKLQAEKSALQSAQKRDREKEQRREAVHKRTHTPSGKIISPSPGRRESILESVRAAFSAVPKVGDTTLPFGTIAGDEKAQADVGNTAAAAGLRSAAGFTGAGGALLGGADALTSKPGDNAFARGAGKLNAVYDTLDAEANAALGRAKEGKGKLGQTLVDVGVAGGQMLGDAAIAAATGGSALVPMAARVFGDSSQQARREGASSGQQIAYGAASAAVEVLTERMFDGLAGVYGKGAADDIVKGVIGKLTKNETVRRLLGVAASAGGESVEELVSSLANPALQAIYNGKSLGQNYSELEAKDALYNMLVGGILGALGGGTQVSTTEQDVTAQGAQQSATDATEAYTRLGDPAKAAAARAALVGKALAGEQLSPGEVRALRLGNAEHRAAFQELTGIDLPANTSAILSSGKAAELAALIHTKVGTQSSASTAQQDTQPSNALDTTEDAYFKLGVDLKTAREIAALAEKARAGEQLSPGEVRALRLKDAKWRKAFEAHTGQTIDPASAEKLNTAQLAKLSQQIRESALDQIAQATGHTRAEVQVMSEYRDAVDSRLLNWINRVKAAFDTDAQRASKMKLVLGEVQENTARAVSEACGVDASGYSHMIDGSAVRHIEQRHGENGVADTSMSDPEDLARVSYVLEHFDSCTPILENDGTPKVSKQYRDKQNRPAPLVQFMKRVDGYAFVVEAAPNSADQKLHIVSAYAQKNSGSINQELNMKDESSPQPTPEAPLDPVASADSSISQPGENVKGSDDLTGRNDSVGSARAAFTPEQVQSQDSSTASALNAEERQMEGLRPEDATHQKLTNAESLAKARERLDLDYEGEKADLPNIRDWGAVEMDMAQIILRDEVEKARKSGDYAEVIRWKKLIDERKSTTGQALQANAKYSGDPASIVSDAAETLEGSKLTQDERAAVLETIGKQADKLSRIDDTDMASLAELVKENSTIRRTNSLFGNRLSKAMNALIDGDSTDHLRLVAQAQIESMASDHVARSAGEKARSLRVMAMLSNLATVTRNLVSNNVFDPVDSLANNAGLPLDMLLSKITGTRSTALDMSWVSKVKRQASAEAAARSAIEVALDVDTDGGTTRYGQSSKRTFKMAGGPVERFLSTWAKWEGFLLNTTDEFQKGGIEAEMQRGLEKLKQKGKIADDSLDSAGENMAKYRTFQDDTRLSEGMSKLHDAGNTLLGMKDGSFGAGDVVLPFAKVPSNLVARAWDYSPAGVAKGLYDLAATLKAAHAGTLTAEQQAQAVHELGRGTTGTALIAGFAYLAQQGLLRVAGDDEDKDKAALDAAEGKTGMQLNLDAISRHFNGESSDWREGDTLMSVGFLDPISAQMMIGALLAEDIDENGLTAKGIAQDSAYGTLQTILDLPGMSTIQSMMNDYKYSDEATQGGKLKDAALGAAADLPASFVPNALKAVAKGTDNSYRNLYTGDTLADETRDALVSAVPGARKTLPDVLDPFGRTKTYTDDDTLNLLNATLLPGAITHNKQDAVSAELERLYKATGNVTFYPNKSAPTSISVDGKAVTLSNEEKRTYQKAYGSAAYEQMKAIQQSSAYRRADDTDRIKYLSQCLSYATDVAKHETLGTDLNSTDAAAQDAKSRFGIQTSDYLAAKAATAGIRENVKDKKGKGIEDSKSLLLMQAIYQAGVTEGLNRKQREALFKSLGVNEGCRSYSAQAVRTRLLRVERQSGLKLVK